MVSGLSSRGDYGMLEVANLYGYKKAIDIMELLAIYPNLNLNVTNNTPKSVLKGF